ncbi:MAG: hypothetical protein ACK4TA_11960 [Saprospiraceae bacterium]
MKKLFLILALGCVLIPCAQSQSAWNEAAEKKAILATLEQETACFYQRNYDCWKATWAQTDYVFQAWNNDNGTFDASTGWKAVDNRIGTFIKEHPVAAGGSSHPKVERRNMIFKFYGDNMVYMTWDQYNSDKEVKYYLLSKEVRMLEKQQGQWKIVNVSAFWDYDNKIPVGDLK